MREKRKLFVALDGFFSSALLHFAIRLFQVVCKHLFYYIALAVISSDCHLIKRYKLQLNSVHRISWSFENVQDCENINFFTELLLVAL
jgi:hypothetical protein